MSTARKYELAAMSESRDDRQIRAIAIACASLSFRGEVKDITMMLSLADDFADYIKGSGVIPRPDRVGKGR